MSKTRSSFRLPPVYPITDTRISGLSHAEQVALFADGGATVVQLRDKHASGSQFYGQAKAALAVAADRGVRIVINDRVDVALALGGVDVHLGQNDLPPEAARRLLGDDAVIGFSTHNLNQAIEAATWPIDYVAIGPVFPTSTKENPDPVVGLEGVRLVRAATGASPLVAIGGITAANAEKVIHAGADSVAMISGLLTVPGDISSNLRNLLASFPT
ncbi:MAG: thiamine phosphate synthase [Acidobacteria bacterium]|nr:thiamine phosphate synthase [Acidobacteriota bacterium]MCA1627232.1 thiamine phosphate synthase [Acidobacteriota bacterium]